MEGLASIAAVTLAAVLIWSATAKLRRPEETARQFRTLGLPAAGALAKAVPGAELVVAVLLVVIPGWGGVAAFALLAAFTVLLVGIVRSGREVGCGCFGSASDDPVSWVEVMRNVGLLAMAALAASITSLVWPSLAELVSATALAIIGGVLMQLASLKHDLGTVFGTTLAGEIPAEELERA